MHKRNLDFGERRNIREKGSLFSGFWELGFPLFNYGESEVSVAFPFSILGPSPIVKRGHFLSLDLKRIFFYSLYVMEEFWGKRTTFLRALHARSPNRNEVRDSAGGKGSCLREWDPR